MKNDLVFYHSSVTVTLPAIGIGFFLCIVCAFFGQSFISSIFMLMALTALTARLWAFFSLRKLDLSLIPSSCGIFPGEELSVKLTMENRKFLPLIWTELFMPLPADLFIVPEELKDADDQEAAHLYDLGMNAGKTGNLSLGPLLWYESFSADIRLKGMSRGLYPLSLWRLHSGDVFGLVKMQMSAPGAEGLEIAVWPRPVPTDMSVFRRRLINSDPGTKGLIKDHTLIRSSRDYMPGDPARDLNWRLIARGLPLTVNVYESILPGQLHFIFDGESFSGPEKHPEEMEEALGMLAYISVRLSSDGTPFSLSMPKGALRKETRTDGSYPEEILNALAAYKPLPDELEKENNSMVFKRQHPVFDRTGLAELISNTGHFFYICMSLSFVDLKEPFLEAPDPSSLTVISFESSPADSAFNVISADSLKSREETA